MPSSLHRAIAGLSRHYRITSGSRFSLSAFDPDDTRGLELKDESDGLLHHAAEVYSFKAPSSEELDHDFLWRTSRVLPRRGHIGIFNRSYYEEPTFPEADAETLRRPRGAERQLRRDTATPSRPGKPRGRRR